MPNELVAYARTWYVVLNVNPEILLVIAPTLVPPSVVFVPAVVGLAVKP